MTAEFLPTLAITTGEPAGIGPDICLQIAQQPLECRLVLFADYDLLKTRAEALQLPVQLVDIDTIPPERHQPGHLYVYHIPLAQKTTAGILNPSNAAYVITMLQQAVTGCCENAMTPSLPHRYTKES